MKLLRLTVFETVALNQLCHFSKAVGVGFEPTRLFTPDNFQDCCIKHALPPYLVSGKQGVWTLVTPFGVIQFSKLVQQTNICLLSISSESRGRTDTRYYTKYAHDYIICELGEIRTLGVSYVTVLQTAVTPPSLPPTQFLIALFNSFSMPHPNFSAAIKKHITASCIATLASASSFANVVIPNNGMCIRERASNPQGHSDHRILSPACFPISTSRNAVPLIRFELTHK